MVQSNNERIQSVDDLEFSACVSLISQLLINTYNIYKTSLIYWKDNRKKYLKVFHRISKYEEYIELKERYEMCLKMTKPYKSHKKFMASFLQMEVIKKPSKEDYDFYYKYLENRSEIDECVRFYRSPRYQIFCMGDYEDGEQVMERAKKEIGL